MTTTKTLGGITISGQENLLYYNTTDGTAVDLPIKDITGVAKSIGVMYKAGGVLTDLWITVATPSDLDKIQLLDSNGGIVNEWQGCINAALGHCPQFEIHGLKIPIKAGYTLMVTTSD